MRKGRFIKSLQAQLPIAFAGIALIATTLIGALLYFIVWNYYTKLEQNYLDVNLHGMADNMSRISNNFEIQSSDSLMDIQDVFQNQVKITAFLVQSRVKILDIDQNVIADSGSPSESWNIIMSEPRLSNQNQLPVSEESEIEQPATNEISSAYEDGDAPLLNNADDQNNVEGSSFSLEPSDEQSQQDNGRPAYSLQANANLFGFQLMQATKQEYNRRSSFVVSTPFYGVNDEIIGYVEISECPNYGRRIISNVLHGWGVASLVGVVVAIAAGYMMSWRLTKPIIELEKVASEMKDGNFQIRSNVYNPTELASLSDTINQMAAHIQHSIETLRHFVSDAAHEIHTPLTSLRADLNLVLTERTVSEAEPMIRRSLQQIERLDQLSRDLLDLSRLESKGERLKPELFNLNDKLLEICEIHASAAEQADVDFNVNLQKEDVYIKGDAGQFQRAVSNLLNNAVKFTPPGGYVTLSMITESQSVLVLVEDSGIGIPMDERGKLFNRFHRGKNTQNYPGSGLGLAISKAIVEKHNGSIGILPDTEKTIFFIRLPLADKKT